MTVTFPSNCIICTHSCVAEVPVPVPKPGWKCPKCGYLSLWPEDEFIDTHDRDESGEEWKRQPRC